MLGNESRHRLCPKFDVHHLPPPVPHNLLSSFISPHRQEGSTSCGNRRSLDTCKAMLLSVASRLLVFPFSIVATGAVDREFENIVVVVVCSPCFFEILGPNLAPRRSGSGLNERGVSAKPILAGFHHKRSHGDPFRNQKLCFC